MHAKRMMIYLLTDSSSSPPITTTTKPSNEPVVVYKYVLIQRQGLACGFMFMMSGSGNKENCFRSGSCLILNPDAIQLWSLTRSLIPRQFDKQKVAQ